ncbi:MAG TPA: nuclease-related domain-containing protein [Nocardioidaceae bacterium]|nr:nuclease-related domain-containing protein [Nocardioidaceae bacterium]
MDDQTGMNDKRLRLRYAGICRECGMDLPARTEAIYERSSKTVRCVAHGEPPEDAEVQVQLIESGTPGGSARREFERRKAARENRIRAKHPRIGGFLLALSEDPQSTRAWDTGAVGEERLGNRLNAMASDALHVLHDRRLPGSRANIDHLVLSPSGVYVIDAKKYKGRPRLRVDGGLIRPRVERLLVGTRDCTKVVDGVLKQVEVVRTVVGDEIAVHGALCFVDADWPLIGGSFATRGVEVVWPKRLVARLESTGPMGVDTLGRLHRKLAEALPSA